MAISDKIREAVYTAIETIVGPTFEVGSRGVTLVRKIRDFPVEILVRACIHGLRQKAADRVASFKAKDMAEVEAAMVEVLDLLQSGEWVTQGTQLLAMARTIILNNQPKGTKVEPFKVMADLEACCSKLGYTVEKVLAAAQRAIDAKKVDDLK